MSIRHLNYFFPYSGDVAHFETSLTRAFFALLHLCPAVHAHFVAMIRERNSALLSFIDLQPQSFSLELEVSSLSSAGGDAVLVNLTGAEALDSASPARTEDKRRYDAVLSYDSGWTLLFEAKLGPSDQKDITVNIPHRLHGAVVEIQWSDLIEGVWQLMECGLVRGTDEGLARQFLEYVATKFERLCPYSTLARCDGNRTRVNARCTQLLRSIGSTVGDKLDLSTGATARYAFLVYDQEKEDSFVSLRLYPADTIDQARRFYTPAHVEATANLGRQRGWDVYSNLHLAFMQTGYGRLNGDVTLDDYLQYWLNRMPRHGQTSAGDDAKSGFRSAFEELLKEKLAPESARADFERHFIDTRRREMNICPALGVHYAWPLRLAAELDAQGRFLDQVRERLREALEAWGQSPLVAEP